MWQRERNKWKDAVKSDRQQSIRQIDIIERRKKKRKEEQQGLKNQQQNATVIHPEFCVSEQKSRCLWNNTLCLQPN